MSKNGEIYTAGKNFTLPLALTGWTDSTSALNTESLERIKASLGIECEEVRVLAGGCDQPNIFQQSRRLQGRVDVW